MRTQARPRIQSIQANREPPPPAAAVVCGALFMASPFLGPSLHSLENGADDSADYSSLCRIMGGPGHVLHQFMGEPGDGKRLQPETSGPSQCGQEESVAAKIMFLIPGTVVI
jgi:hypothetical protein